MAGEEGFTISGLFGGINDTFSELAKSYLNLEGIKAQTGALRAQAEYEALANYNPSYLQNPNAVPLSPQQLAALQQSQMGISTPMLLLGGIAIIAIVLVLK